MVLLAINGKFVNSESVPRAAKMKKTLADMEKRIANLEENMVINGGKMEAMITMEAIIVIIVAGGYGTDSVQMFNWRQRTWSPLQSLPKERWGATSFVYNNHMTIAGGWCPSSGIVDNMIAMNTDPHLISQDPGLTFMPNYLPSWNTTAASCMMISR